MEFKNIVTGEAITPLPWQEALKAGDCYIIEQPAFGMLGSPMTPLVGVQVYGQILEPTKKPGFFIVQAYSAMCPEGEIGMLCIVEPSRVISEEEFQRQTAELNHG
jgi:hypothetical protein